MSPSPAVEPQFTVEAVITPLCEYHDHEGKLVVHEVRVNVERMSFVEKTAGLARNVALIKATQAAGWICFVNGAVRVEIFEAGNTKPVETFTLRVARGA